MNQETKLLSTVGTTLGWSTIDNLKSEGEIFVKKVLEEFTPDIIQKIIESTECSNTPTFDSGEWNLDTYELYNFLVNSKTTRTIKYQNLDCQSINKHKYIMVLLEIKNPNEMKNLIDKLLKSYQTHSEEIIFTVKTSDNNSQTITTFD